MHQSSCFHPILRAPQRINREKKGEKKRLRKNASRALHYRSREPPASLVTSPSLSKTSPSWELLFYSTVICQR